MDKVAMYKEYIQKEAMALSTRNFSAAQQSAISGLAYRYGKRAVNIEKEVNKTVYQKKTPSIDALNFLRKRKLEMPQGSDLKVIDTNNKKAFGDLPAVYNAMQKRHNLSNKMTSGKALTGKEHKEFRKSINQTVGSDAASIPSTNTIIAPKHDVGSLAHELAHSQNTKGNRINNLKDLVTTDKKISDLKEFGKEDSKSFLNYVRNGYMDGNRTSKRMGRRLFGAWNEAMKKGDKQYLEELRANAQGYHDIHKHLGKEVADNTLDSNLASILSYTEFNSPKKKQHKLMSEVLTTPIKTKGKYMMPMGYYNGERNTELIPKK